MSNCCHSRVFVRTLHRAGDGSTRGDATTRLCVPLYILYFELLNIRFRWPYIRFSILVSSVFETQSSKGVVFALLRSPTLLSPVVFLPLLYLSHNLYLPFSLRSFFLKLTHIPVHVEGQSSTNKASSTLHVSYCRAFG